LVQIVLIQFFWKIKWGFRGYGRGQNKVLEFPLKIYFLKRYFGIETEWENPDNIVGPKETEIEFDKTLGQGKPRTKAKVYRPAIKLSQDVIPLAHSSNSNNDIPKNLVSLPNTARKSNNDQNTNNNALQTSSTMYACLH